MFLSFHVLLHFLGLAVCLYAGRDSALMDHVLHNYDKRLMPQSDAGNLLISFKMKLRKVVELNVKKQKMWTTSFITQRWRDPRLAWEPDDFNNTRRLPIHRDSVWRPDIILIDNIDEHYVDTVEKDISVIATYDGEVIYSFPAVFITSCLLDLYYFPFDVHTCSMHFAPWGYNADKLWLKYVPVNYTEQPIYLANNGWKLKNFTGGQEREPIIISQDNTLTSYVRFDVNLQRHYIVNFYYFYYPNLLINLITTLQFLLPCDMETKKMTLGVMLILINVMYLVLTTSTLPIASRVPIVVQFQIASFCLVVISLVFTIFMLVAHYTGRHDNNCMLPELWRRVFLHGLAKMLCVDKYVTDDDEYQRILAKAFSYVSLAEDDDDPLPEDPLIVRERLRQMQQEQLQRYNARKGTTTTLSESEDEEYELQSRRGTPVGLPYRRQRIGSLSPISGPPPPPIIAYTRSPSVAHSTRGSIGSRVLPAITKRGTLPDIHDNIPMPVLPAIKPTQEASSIAASNTGSTSSTGSTGTTGRIVPPGGYDVRFASMLEAPVSARKFSLLDPDNTVTTLGQFSQRRVSCYIRPSEMKNKDDEILFKVLKHVERRATAYSDKDKAKEMQCEWQQLAMVLDRLFAILYVIITLSLWIYVFTNQADLVKERIKTSKYDTTNSNIL